MNSQQNSQDQQGFIAVKLVPKVSDIEDIRDSKGRECRMFTPFYLPSGQGNMRLELPQSLEQIQDFEIENECSSNNQIDQRNLKTKPFYRNNSNSCSLQHPFRIYIGNPSFQLIYSRNSSDEPIFNEFQYIKNDVFLQTANTQHQEHFVNQQKRAEPFNILRNPYSRLLKSFQFSNSIPPINSNFTNSQSSKSNNQLLMFDSKFQSGNLNCVYYNYDTHQYHLFLENDTNSYGYNQWFYFSLANIKKNIQYKFVIVNFKKKHSFFRQNYKPIVFSLKKFQLNKNKNGWSRKGINVHYEDSHITTSKFFKFYKLNFSLKFEYQNDYTLVAANLPYSYTKLSNYLQKFSKKFKQSNQIEQISDLKISALGRSFCGSNVPQIKLSPLDQKKRKHKSPSKGNKNNTENKKKMIIFLARQHPGETVSSYLMEKLLNNFCSFGSISQNQRQKQLKQNMKYLLKNYTILIFPMINIDGVIYGNSRCDISGMDLNRRWRTPSKIFHPQIFNIKNKIQYYARKYDIVGCLDLHGHSKLYNVFCYSCKISPVSCRILPYMISKETSKFSFASCTFGITRQKSTTARATIFKTIKNQNVLTIQMSYFGYVEQNKQKFDENITHFTQNKPINHRNRRIEIHYFQPRVFHQIAEGVLKGLYSFLNKQKAKYLQVQKEIQKNLNQILKLEKLSHQNQAQDGSGSESDPQGDEIDFQTKIKTVLGKQFLQQAEFFKPVQQQIIDMDESFHTKSILFGNNAKPIHTKTLSKDSKDQQQQSLQKQQHINKIRIIKRKPQINNRKTLSNQKFKSELAFNNFTTNKSKKTSLKKEMAQIPINRNQKIVTAQQRIREKKFSTGQNQINYKNSYNSKNQNLSFGKKKYSQMLIRDQSPQQKQEKQKLSTKVYDDLIIYSAQSKQMINYEKSNLLEKKPIGSNVPSQNEFFIKFQKFLPSHPLPAFNKKQKLSFLEQSIYKDDQKQILSTLLQNKKKLQNQKRKRSLQKSTIIAERYHNNSKKLVNELLSIKQDQKQIRTNYGKMGMNGRKREEIVDFKRFRDRNKLKMQLKQADEAYLKFFKKEGYC